MVYELQAGISARRLDRHLGQTMRVLVDEVGTTSIGRSSFDAPEIDGVVHISEAADLGSLHQGEFAWVKIERHDDHDLFGRLVGDNLQLG